MDSLGVSFTPTFISLPHPPNLLVTLMPQVMCPNCGTTINLKNRKEVDFKLIQTATENFPKSFTELLHMTKLSRKTLNIRLTEMCQEGVLVKANGVYKLNGSSHHTVTESRNHVTGLSRFVHDKRVRTGLFLIIFLISSSASGYVLATLMQPRVTEPVFQEPQLVGNFTMALKITDAQNLQAWQVPISFNDAELKFMKATTGSFFQVEQPLIPLLNTTDNENLLLLGSALGSDQRGSNGNGTLAFIVFGYYSSNYEMPKITATDYFETLINDPVTGALVAPSGQTQITLEPIS